MVTLDIVMERRLNPDADHRRGLIAIFFFVIFLKDIHTHSHRGSKPKVLQWSIKERKGRYRDGRVAQDLTTAGWRALLGTRHLGGGGGSTRKVSLSLSLSPSPRSLDMALT